MHGDQAIPHRWRRCAPSPFGAMTSLQIAIYDRNPQSLFSHVNPLVALSSPSSQMLTLFIHGRPERIAGTAMKSLWELRSSDLLKPNSSAAAVDDLQTIAIGGDGSSDRNKQTYFPILFLVAQSEIVGPSPIVKLCKIRPLNAICGRSVSAARTHRYIPRSPDLSVSDHTLRFPVRCCSDSINSRTEL